MTELLAYLRENHSFYLTLTEDLTLQEASPAFCKISNLLRPGASVDECLKLTHPPLPLNADTIHLFENQLVTLRLRDRDNFAFSGIFKPAENGGLMFLGFPQLSSTNQLGQLGLSINDFVPSDPIRFYIGTLQVKQSALSDSLALTRRLEEQKLSLEQQVAEKTRAIRHSEESLRRLINNAVVGIVILDADKILFANDSSCTILGSSAPCDIIGQAFFDYFNEQDRVALEKCFRTTQFEATNSVHQECQIIRPDKQITWAEIQLQKTIWEEQEATLVWLIDISERKVHEQRQNELLREVNFQKYALDQHAIVSMADTSGNITYVNEKFLKTCGYTTEELLGVNHRILKSGVHDKAFYDGMWNTVSQGKAWHGEVCDKAKDGSTFWVAATIVPFLDDHGKALRYISIRTDISSQKRYEEELLHAKNVAEHATRTKSNFLSNMSHEIRTPMNAVIGLSSIGIRDANGGKCAQVFEQIHDSGQHLLRIINDILDYAKIESGRMQIDLRSIQLIPTVEQAFGMITEHAASKGLALSLEISSNLPAWVKGDSLRIQQVLINLLANAVKFTDSGEIRLRVYQHGHDTCFEVSDSGIGMNDLQKHNLFKPFEQADASTTRNFGGSGLGLAISQNLASLMHGSISVESEIGVGSQFTLHLPLEPASPARTTAPKQIIDSKSSKPLAGLRLLAAEDVDINRLILDDLIVTAGGEVVFAENGKQAVEKVVEMEPGQFDAVLMDVQMPVMDGHEATRRILEFAPQLPVIGLTAHAFAEERERCLAAGMVDHVAKPIDPDTLYTTILRHTRRR